MFPKIGGKHQKWMFFFMEKTLWTNGMIWGTPIFWKHPYILWFCSYLSNLQHECTTVVTVAKRNHRVGSRPRLQWDPRWQREAWRHRNILGVAPLPGSQWHILGFCHWCLFSGLCYVYRESRYMVWKFWFLCNILDVAPPASSKPVANESV